MLVNLELMENYLKRIPDINMKVIDDFIGDITQEIDTRYIERPKDLNGHYIYINDSLKDKQGHPFTVSSMEFTNSGSWIIYSAHMLGYEHAKWCRHYTKPSVEDMLKYFIDECGKVESDKDKDAIIKKYSKNCDLCKNMNKFEIDCENS